MEKIDIDAIARGIDLDAIVDKIDVDAIVRRVDVDAIVSQVDIDAISRRIDVDSIVDKLDIDAIVRRVDVDAIVAQVDIDVIAKRIDVDAIVEKLDIDAIVDRVDIDAIVRRLDLVSLAEEIVNGIDLPEIIRESTGSMASEVVRDVRMQSIDADVAIARIVDRLIRRRRARRTEILGKSDSNGRADLPEQLIQHRLTRCYPQSRSDPSRSCVHEHTLDPVPYEARPYQGRRAGLITRSVAAAIDLGLVVIALGVAYLAICAFLFLLDPRNFTAPTPSLGLVLPSATRCSPLSRRELDGYRPDLRQPRHGVARREP